MDQWLYGLISAEAPDRRPDFAQTSALNWMHALAFEIRGQHGQGSEAQRQSLDSHFSSVQPRGPIPHSARVFESLYAAVTFTTSLISLASETVIGAWRCPGAIVEWYYAVYNASRAMIAACNLPAPSTHAAVSRTLNSSVRGLLPHPLDMRAVHTVKEKFDAQLPSIRHVPRHVGASALTETFNGTRPHAQQMLLSYLHGTAKYYVWEAKQRMLKKELKKAGLTSFRSNAAKQIRDAKLKGTEYNILSVAFRYRGKANYRDAVFLGYGPQHLSNGEEFVQDLATVARFATMAGVSYVRARLGGPMCDAFSRDLEQNFSGYTALKSFP